MNDTRPDPITTLEQNVDRLLRAHDLEASMTEPDRRRVLNTLLADRANAPARVAPAPRVILGSWRFALPAALAFAAVAIATVLLVGRGRDGIAWAEVARKLATVHSFRAIQLDDRGDPPGVRPGTRIIHRSSIYVSEDRGREDSFAGLGRAGVPPASELPIMTWIWKMAPGRTVRILIDRDRGTAHADTTDRRGVPVPDSVRAMRGFPDRTPMDYWTMLRAMATDRATALGTRTIDGKELAGFESDLSRRDAEAPAGANAKVWVDPQTGEPRQVEFFLGTVRQQRLVNIQWNVTLPDSMFQLPRSVVPGDHPKRMSKPLSQVQTRPRRQGTPPPPAVTGGRTVEYGFGMQRLKPGVRLEVGAPGKPAEITELDVVGVDVGVVGTAPGRNAEILKGVTFQLTPDGLERLNALMHRRLFKTVVTRFDGRVMAEPMVREDRFPNLSMWVEPLSLTPEQFASRYLMKP